MHASTPGAAPGNIGGRVNESGTIHVILVEDDEATREGLRTLVDGTPGLSCAADFPSVEQAVESTSGAPDVLLLDIHLEGMPGSEGVALLKKKWPTARILMLTVYAEEDKVFESICNGADGYLLKRTSPARLIEAIREAHAEGASMSPEIARKVMGLFRRVAPPPATAHDLTPQELRVLGLLAQGHSYQAMADRLTVSINTVRNYIRSIYEKLHVHSRSEAVGKALRGRLI